MIIINVKAVARKEFYHLLRDFRSLYLAFVMPLLLILIFGYALSLDVDNIETIVVDYDNTGLSRDFIKGLHASPYFNIGRYRENSRVATAELDHGTAKMVIIIPPDWTEKLKSDRDSPIQILLDGSDPNFAAISRGYINAFIDGYNQKNLLLYLNRMGREPIEPPIDARIRVWFNEDLESKKFIIPGIIAIILVIVGAMLTSLVIAREYENATMETIKSLPVGGGEFLLGKAIPYFFIGMVDVLMAVLMGQVLFGVVMKSSFWLMILASAVYLWVALSLGLLISIVTRSQLVANQVAFLLTYLPSFLLSDFVFPVTNIPAALQWVSRIVPTTYFIDILNGLYLRNLGLGDLWHDYTILLSMALVISMISFFTLKKEGM
ncbi:MAG: ABC transporter permease [Deltaproteobacteria bacterium]|nr:ABC transporter permease [Deltaproteobacteria bacterium]